MIEIDSKAAAVTLSVLLPDTDPDVAVTTVEPTATEVASPVFTSTVAMIGVPEVQLTLFVKLPVLVSVNVPVAVNCCVSPFGTLGLDGVTATDTNPPIKDTRAIFVVPLTR